MHWLIYACLSRICFAVSNILDSHFCVGYFKNLICQMFYFGAYQLIFLAIAFLFFPVPLLSPELMFWALLSGLCLALHGVPYLSALKSADTSTVVSLFTLGRVFAPIMSYLLVKEVLDLNEVIGFGITILGSLWHAYKPESFKVDYKLVLKMMLAGFMVASFSVCSKKLFLELDVYTGVFYIFLFDSLFCILTIFIPLYTNDIIETVKRKDIRIPYVANVIIAMIGHVLSFTAISLTKVTHVVLIGQFQAFFALAISYLFFRSSYFKHNESLKRRDVMQKMGGFVIMAVGAYWALGR